MPRPTTPTLNFFMMMPLDDGFQMENDEMAARKAV
jgi:hypothetical protein